MKKNSDIKWRWLLIIALLVGEILVWTFPYPEGLQPFHLNIGQFQRPVAEESEKLPQQTPEPPQEEPEENEMEIEKPESPTEKTSPPKGAGGYSQNPTLAENNGLLILVNKEHYLAKDDVPADLASVLYFAKDRSPEGRYMRKEAAEQFNQMVEAAGAEGYEIVMTTAYRSYGFQSTLYNNYVANHGKEEADRFSARPGFSEHQTGLAVDVSAPSVGYALTQEFENTEEWRWLRAHAREYGFILRYPAGKTEVTGYMYEPWHFRYVGGEIARSIEEANITLEEYLRSE